MNVQKPSYQDLEKRIIELESGINSNNDKRYQELFNNMTCGCTIWKVEVDEEQNKSFVLIDMNRSAEIMDDLKKDDLIGKSIDQLFPEPVKKLDVIETLSESWETGELIRFPLAKYEVYGKIVWRDNFVYKLPSGELVIIFDDVTEQILAREALKKEKDLSEEYINSLPGLFYVFEEDRFVKWNKEWERITGYSTDQIASMVATDFFEGFDKVYIKKKMEEVYREGTSEADADLITKEGKSIPYYFSGLRIKVKDKYHLIGFGLDISKQKYAEKELIRAKEKAEESDKLKSSFLSNISHEIRTPINSILGFSELLTQEDLSIETKKKYFEFVSSGGNRLLSIISDIVDASKIDSNQISLNYQTCNLNQIINNLHQQISVTSKKKNVSINIKKELFDNDSYINVDKTRLIQILTNLIENAIKFTKEGNVEFGYNLVQSKAEKELKFFVKDTGVGIDENNLKIIFERFRQIDDDQSMLAAGTGLGLSIVEGLVELFQGKIWVESEVNKGSIFYFTIPYHKASPFENKKNNVSDSVIEDNSKITVLIVEDEDINMEYLKAFFEKYKYKTIHAKNGIEAVEVIRSNSIDLILMDIRMPLMNGYDAAIEIRKVNNSVPIVIQSAFVRQEDKQRAIEIGITDFISKPISVDLLNDVIRKYLTNKTKTSNTKYNLDGWQHFLDNR